MEKEVKNTMNEAELQGIGSVQIADEVIAEIVGIAATEVDGVSATDGNITNDLMSKVGIKNLAKGVKATIVNGAVAVEINLTVKYGYNIPATCAKVQEKIMSTVENMTGLKVTDVNVRITGVEMQKD